jgi:hypothetical protein
MIVSLFGVTSITPCQLPPLRSKQPRRHCRIRKEVVVILPKQSERALYLRRALTRSSRRAVPIARRVKKPTNRAITSAMTRALVGPATLASVIEPVSKVVI